VSHRGPAPSGADAAAAPARTVVSRFGVPDLGIGVGYRVPHYAEIVETRPRMDWFEVLSENFLVDGGSPLHWLRRLAAAYPCVPHGVSLSLGGPGDPEHLTRLAGLVRELAPPWASDHLCFTASNDANSHDLLPLPYTEAIRDHVVRRILEAKAALGVVFAVENVSSYLTYRASQMTEWDFLADVSRRADCGILLDVNNVFVSSVNHGFDPMVYLDAVPADRVVQIHLAGHTVMDGYRIDTHDGPVCDEVWALYGAVIERIGSVSTLIEWDGNVPSFARLQEEADHAREVRDAALARRARSVVVA
jgi:uncharacterized protein (UPF0276 family)